MATTGAADSIWSDEEKNTFFGSYRQSLLRLRCGRTIEAFEGFKKLLPYMGSDPVLWLRLSECCIYTLCEIQIPIDFMDSIGTGFNNASPYCMLESTQPCSSTLSRVGISMTFAEMAMSTCMVLARNSNSSLLKQHAIAQAAFIAMKRDKLRYAKKLLKSLMDEHEKELPGYLKTFAGLIKLECDVKCGLFDKVYKELIKLDYSYLDDYMTDKKPIIDLESYNSCIAHCARGEYDLALAVYENLIHHSASISHEQIILGAYIFTGLNRFDRFRRTIQHNDASE